MLICYDKAFPEAARALALDGAEIIACLSAWPAARTAASPDLADDRWTHRFDLFDQARALENQVVWVGVQPEPARSARCASWAAPRSSAPAATCWPTTGVEPGVAARRRRRPRRCSPAARPGDVRTCATAVPTPTRS